MLLFKFTAGGRGPPSPPPWARPHRRPATPSWFSYAKPGPSGGYRFYWRLVEVSWIRESSVTAEPLALFSIWPARQARQARLPAAARRRAPERPATTPGPPSPKIVWGPLSRADRPRLVPCYHSQP